MAGSISVDRPQYYALHETHMTLQEPYSGSLLQEPYLSLLLQGLTLAYCCRSLTWLIIIQASLYTIWFYLLAQEENRRGFLPKRFSFLPKWMFEMCAPQHLLPHSNFTCHALPPQSIILLAQQYSLFTTKKYLYKYTCMSSRAYVDHIKYTSATKQGQAQSQYTYVVLSGFKQSYEVYAMSFLECVCVCLYIEVEWDRVEWEEYWLTSTIYANNTQHN